MTLPYIRSQVVPVRRTSIVFVDTYSVAATALRDENIHPRRMRTR